MKALLAALLFAGVALAQEAPVQKIVPVKNGNINQIFPTVRDILQPAGLIVKAYENSVILSGKPDLVAAGEQLVKNLEASTGPQRDVEITGYVILASAEGSGAAGLPPDLDAVLKQFRNLLNYKTFRVMDTLILRAREGTPAQSSGLLALPDAHAGSPRMGFLERGATVADDAIHISNLQLEWGPAEIRADVDIKAGQKVAIGKSSVDAAGDALILIVSAKVVD